MIKLIGIISFFIIELLVIVGIYLGNKQDIKNKMACIELCNLKISDTVTAVDSYMVKNVNNELRCYCQDKNHNFYLEGVLE